MTPITDRTWATYVVPEREGGVRAALAALVKRRTRDVQAVAEVSFTVEPGEIVGFLGPNGAGKTTTLKMLAGLLHPTTGTADVLGYTPWRRDRDYLGRMSLIMGRATSCTGTSRCGLLPAQPGDLRSRPRLPDRMDEMWREDWPTCCASGTQPQQGSG